MKKRSKPLVSTGYIVHIQRGAMDEENTMKVQGVLIRGGGGLMGHVDF